MEGINKMEKELNTTKGKDKFLSERKGLAMEEKIPTDLEGRKEVISSVEYLTEGSEITPVSEVNGEITKNKDGSSQTTVSTVELPSIDVMAIEAIEKIEGEIHDLTVEAIKLQHSAPIDYYRLNEVVKRTRYLNGILDALKNAVTVAHEYVVDIWKEFVQSKK